MKEHPYITCRELIDFIAEYLDGQLAAPARHEFERHLNVCSSCVAYLDAYKKAVLMGKMALSPSDDPAPVPEGLSRAIRAARARPG